MVNHLCIFDYNFKDVKRVICVFNREISEDEQ